MNVMMIGIIKVIIVVIVRLGIQGKIVKLRLMNAHLIHVIIMLRVQIK